MARRFLPELLAARRASIDRARETMPTSFLRDAMAMREPPRDFAAAINGQSIALIAEFKRASPSKGPIAVSADPVSTAQAFERGGASAISVLTEPDFFLGSPDDLVAAKNATGLPVLWKDFVVDPYQVEMARAFGADAVLLIVRILPDETLRSLAGMIRDLHMTAVVEVFDEGDLETAIDIRPAVIGINNRDLETFEEDPQRVAKLAPLARQVSCVAGFSAVSSRAQVEAMQAAGVRAVLVGESVMRAPDPADKIRELLGA